MTSPHSTLERQKQALEETLREIAKRSKAIVDGQIQVLSRPMITELVEAQALIISASSPVHLPRHVAYQRAGVMVNQFIEERYVRARAHSLAAQEAVVAERVADSEEGDAGCEECIAVAASVAAAHGVIVPGARRPGFRTYKLVRSDEEPSSSLGSHPTTTICAPRH